MFKKVNKNENRLARHKRVRKKVSGTPERPRLSVYRSAKNIYVQIIDDINKTTLVAASTIDKEMELGDVYGGNKEAAKKVGELIAKKAAAKGGYLYHGRVQALAEAAREAGLKF